MIVLENVPQDSEILIDGGKIAFTWPGVGRPVEIRAAPGQRKVEVKREGYKTFGAMVSVRTDEPEKVAVRLEPLGAFRPVTKRSEEVPGTSEPVAKSIAGSDQDDNCAAPYARKGPARR